MKKIISILLIALVSNNLFLENAKFKEPIILQSTVNFIIEGKKYANEVLEILYEIEKKIFEYIFKKNDEIYNTLKDKAFTYFNNTFTKKSDNKADIKKYYLEIIKEIRNSIEKLPKILEEEKKKYINYISGIKFSNFTVQNDFNRSINSFSEEMARSIGKMKENINDFLHFDEKKQIEEFFYKIEKEAKKFRDKYAIKNEYFRIIGELNYDKSYFRRDIIQEYIKIRNLIEDIKYVFALVDISFEKYKNAWNLEKVYEIITYLSNIEPEKIIEIFKYTVETIKNIFKRKEINELINLFNRVINIPKEYICKELINILQVFVKDIVSGEYFINYDFEKIYKKINEILKWGISYIKSIKSEKDFYKEFQKYLPDIRETILTFNIHQYINYNENDVKKIITITYDYLKLYIHSVYYLFYQYNKI